MANRFDSLIDAWNPVIRRAFLDGIFALRDRAQIDQIAAMLERGDVEAAIRAVGLDPVSFRPFDKSLADAFEAGGNATAKLVPISRDATGLRTVFQFNVRNPVAEAWLTNHAGTAIREIVDDQRGMIRGYLTDAMSKGLNPRTAALDLVGRISPTTGRREGGTIGITSSQEEWVRKYAEELATNPAETLARKLRDKRFDRVAAKGDIPAETRAKMVRNYRNNALRYRAEAIARTEAMASLHQSQEEAMRQAMEQGLIEERHTSYVWRTARDKRVRDTHQTMDGQVRRVGEKFVTGSGAELLYPGDPSGPAAEIINCRCWREPKVDFLAGAL